MDNPSFMNDLNLFPGCFHSTDYMNDINTISDKIPMSLTV